jgi:DNA-binding MarR family transcriptional regulator
MDRSSKEQATRAAKQIAGACYAVRLRAVNRAVSSIYDDALRPLEMKASQLNVLVAIAMVGEAQPVHVARALHMDKSTLSRNVDKMKARGWIRSRDAPGGGQLLTLSAAGDKLLSQALPLWKRAQAQTEELLGGEGADALHSIHSSL